MKYTILYRKKARRETHPGKHLPGREDIPGLVISIQPEPFKWNPGDTADSNRVLLRDVELTDHQRDDLLAFKLRITETGFVDVPEMDAEGNRLWRDGISVLDIEPQEWELIREVCWRLNGTDFDRLGFAEKNAVAAQIREMGMAGIDVLGTVRQHFPRVPQSGILEGLLREGVH